MEHPYNKEANQPEGTLLFAQFSLSNYLFNAMSGIGEHNFDFNEAISFIINCESQDEVNYYWEKLTDDGGEESVCGWLKDKFGVSWQVIPTAMFKETLEAIKKKAVEL